MVKDRIWQAFEDTGDPVAWLLYNRLDAGEADRPSAADDGRTDKTDGSATA